MDVNGFYISITNNLLEGKHFERMGNAVWLYMWLIDKMTDISEGQGIVNNGYPITFEIVNKDLNSLTRRTYRRMMFALVEAGYVNTMRAPHGLYVTVNKAKKQFNKPTKSAAKYGPSLKKSAAINGTSDVPKRVKSAAKYGRRIYKDLQYNNKAINKADLEITELPLSKTHSARKPVKQKRVKAGGGHILHQAYQICDTFTASKGGNYRSDLHLSALVGLIEINGIDRVQEVTDFAMGLTPKDYQVSITSPVELADKWAKVVQLMEQPEPKKVIF